MTEQFGRPTEPREPVGTTREPVGTTGKPQAYPPVPAVPATGTGATQSDTHTEGRKDAAKQEASDVARHAGQSAGEVKDTAAQKTQETAGEAKEVAQETAGEAKEKAGETLAVAKAQARDLLEQSRSELSQQASSQQTRLAGGLQSLSSELTSLADGNAQSGLAADLARQAGDYLERAGRWFEQREPDEVLTEVKAYARQHPGTFVAIAAGLGLVAGRVARGMKDVNADGENGAARHAADVRSPTPTETDPYRSTTTTTSGSVPGTTTEHPAHGTPTYGSGAPVTGSADGDLR